MCRLSIPARIAVALAPLLFALALESPARAARWFDAPLSMQVASASQGEPYTIDRIAVGDLDADGVPDVATSSALGWTALYRGAGDGAFDPPLVVESPAGSNYTVIADLDADGAADVARCGWDGGSVLFGDGSGRGWARVDLDPADYTTGLVAGDFDEDGRLDLASPSRTGALVISFGRAGRRFESRTVRCDSLLEGFAWSTVAVDLNHDGHLDIVVSQVEAEHDLVLLLGRGDGSFQTRVVAYSGSIVTGSRGLAVTDLTGDDRPDLVVTRGSAITIHPNLGDGAFGTPIVIDTDGERALDVAVADVTGDGLLDLVSTDSDGVRIGTRPGLGGLMFGAARFSIVRHSLYPLVLSDLDGDERLDVVSLALEIGSGSALYSALGDGLGGFGVCTPTRPLASATSPAGAADLDEDGRPDLLLFSPDPTPASAGLDVLLSRPGRAFVHATHERFPRSPENVGGWQIADVNEDGHLDFAAIGDGTRLTVLPGAGDGTFGVPFEVPLPVSCRWDTLADVTGDGHLDIVAITWSRIVVLPGLGAGGFGPGVSSEPGSPITDIVVGDLNSDGKADVVFELGHSSTLRALGSADGHFAVEDFAGLPYDTRGMAIADVNGDGRADLVAIAPYCIACTPPWYAELQLFLQRADGGLEGPIPSACVAVSEGHRPCVVDLDRDGHPDIAYRIADGVAIGRGDGTGRFSAAGGFGGFDAVEVGSLPLADFDGDGHLDAALDEDAGHVVVVWGRDPIPPTVALLGPGALPALTPGASATLRWQAHDDVGVAAIDLFVSRHGPRGPFTRIAAGLADSGEFPWTVTAPLSDSVAFKIVARDSAGNVAHAVSAERLRIVDPLAVGSAPAPPARLAITALAPNPARARCAVRFALPRAGRVTLALHDLQGRRLATLLDAEHAAGEGAIDWTLASAGAPLRPGLYFLRLTAGRERAVARLVIAP